MGEFARGKRGEAERGRGTPAAAQPLWSPQEQKLALQAPPTSPRGASLEGAGTPENHLP